MILLPCRTVESAAVRANESPRPIDQTETALELLTEQVHTVWRQDKDKVATLLSIDVASASDTVSHRRFNPWPEA